MWDLLSRGSRSSRLVIIRSSQTLSGASVASGVPFRTNDRRVYANVIPTQSSLWRRQALISCPCDSHQILSDPCSAAADVSRGYIMSFFLWHHVWSWVRSRAVLVWVICLVLCFARWMRCGAPPATTHKLLTFWRSLPPHQRLLIVFDHIGRAAKLRLLNFLSLFRDLQKPTRFSGGGGG